MKRLLGIACLGILALAANTQAADLANGKFLSKSCAVCHGNLNQGTPGRLSPRLAGMPEEYLIKAITEYRDGIRKNQLMVVTANMDTYTDQDVEDVAAYLSRIDLRSDARFDVVQFGGTAENGKELYNDDCKSCHARDGFGSKRKEAPPLAGQHVEYMHSMLQQFKSKVRYHANDPEDDTFEDYTEDELLDITAHIASLDNAKFVEGAVAFVPEVVARQRPAAAKEETRPGVLQITDITQTVAQMRLKEGISREDAADAMRSKAVEINMKMVGEQHVSKELESRGVDTPYLAIFQFCDPMQARTMIVNNPIFASYMPCRIAMVEDGKGETWLMMLNLDMLIENELLPPEVIQTAITVNQQMLDIMVAGATGEF